MGNIITFIIGGVFTLLLLIIGSVIGYMMGTGKMKEKVEEIIKITPQKSSGAVKAITPKEIKDEQEKGFINKMQTIIEE